MTDSRASGEAARFRKAVELLGEGVRGDTYTAAVLLCARGEEIACQAAAGEAHLSSIFDVASLTKPLVSALFFVLAQEGSVSPDGKVGEVIPMKRPDAPSGDILFEQLLAHTSGLPAYKPFFSHLREHDRIVDAVMSLPLDAAPGTQCVYSDPGFIMLGRAMELAGFKPLDRLLKSRIADPLQMRDTCYLPLSVLSECETGRIVSTGYSRERGREKFGEPDDENAAAMGGVAGHAGVFSTTYDLFLFAREILRARRGEGRVLTRRSAVRMTTKVAMPPGCQRTPGWDTPDPSGRSQAGSRFTEGSFGHLGYTGCSIWIDPAEEATVVLLTNRIIKGEQNDGLKILRPLIYDAAMEGLLS
jgi:CubicO group peptidase (beta-lactamase class C family)